MRREPNSQNRPWVVERLDGSDGWRLEKTRFPTWEEAFAEVIEHQLFRMFRASDNTFTGLSEDWLAWFRANPGAARTVPLWSCEPSVRFYNTIIEPGRFLSYPGESQALPLKTAGELADQTEHDLLRRHNFGQKTLAEAVMILGELGLTLKGGFSLNAQVLIETTRLKLVTERRVRAEEQIARLRRAAGTSTLNPPA